MCYQFVLYTGCGHDRSLLYFRARSHTKDCLCRSFSRLPHRITVCPECDRALRIARGQPVPRDHLTEENRAKCQAWREILDNEVKDAENKRLTREARENGKDVSTVTIGREVHVAARHFKHANAHKQRLENRIKNGKNPTGFAPPYVPQPGETFLDHIICEIIDDAKSGGEMERLKKALDIGLQGYGWIGPTGGESWLQLSGEKMKLHGDKMDTMTGSLGPGFLSARDFPALPSASGAASRATLGAVTTPLETIAEHPTPTAQKAAPALSKLRYDPSKTFVPSVPIPEIILTSSPTVATNKSGPAPTIGLLTELPPLAILPLLFEKYEEDGEEVITDGSGTGSSIPTTPAAVENNPYSSSVVKILDIASQPVSTIATSKSPSISVPSKTTTPAPEGPYLGVPQPLPKTIIVPFRATSISPLPNTTFIENPSFVPPAAYIPPPPQPIYTTPQMPRQYNPPVPIQDRSFGPPPMAKLRSQDHNGTNTNNNKHNNSHNANNNNGGRFHSKHHYNRFTHNYNHPHKFAGSHHNHQFQRYNQFGNQVRYQTGHNPLVPGPMPLGIGAGIGHQAFRPVTASQASGPVRATPTSNTSKV
ncbi:hypothetical protein TWF788_007370 [Orbilia oligospora]|uniref:Uncharacterized protein n=1 Tax=Orbilia oligospora TaxID=2813651 RepID=A0A7C8U0K6_ORBOL|nr:hypothetical protein TWF788_007370 [Orbilia oligospora]